MTEKPIEVFFSYSHEDEEFKDELVKHLSILERQDVISGWHDRLIKPGSEWNREIDTYLNSADIILLMLSADFLASDYCWGVEVKKAMQRHEAGEAVVIPVVLRWVTWDGTPFAKLQALPKNAKPIASWNDQDEAYTNICEGIRVAVDELRKARQRRQEAKQQAELERKTEKRRRQQKEWRAELQRQAEERKRLEQERRRQRVMFLLQTVETLSRQAVGLLFRNQKAIVRIVFLVGILSLAGGGLLQLSSSKSSRQEIQFCVEQAPTCGLFLIGQAKAEQFYIRANFKFAQGEKQSAIDDYDQAISLNKNYAEAYYKRGIAHRDLGNLSDAINNYSRSLRLNPPEPWLIHYDRGIALHNLGNFSAAIEDYNKVTEFKKDRADVYYNRGLANQSAGYSQRAIDDYDRAIELSKDYRDYAEAYYKRGIAHKALRRLEEAIGNYTKAISINKDYVEAYYDRGNARKDLGYLEDAIDDYTKAISINKDYANAYYMRGLIRKEQGEKKAAITNNDVPGAPISPHKVLRKKVRLGTIANDDIQIKRGAIANDDIPDTPIKDLGEKKDAIADFQKAADLYKQQGNLEWHKNSLDRLKELQS